LGLFGGNKKKSRDEIIAEGITEAEASVVDQDKKDETFNSGNPKMDMEITKIKAQLESYNEIRKSNSERFSRLSEQMGELRGMIMDTNKTMSKIEVSATKAIDLVESVHPEKLMVEIRKQEGKGEALKANIESNEAMMHDILEELKKVRQQMSFYKGIEQVTKLNEEVKGELIDIKKVEGTIERHADKAETIFIDMEKRFAEFEKFIRTVDDIEKTFHTMQGSFDNMKLDLSKKAEKKEIGSLMDKLTEFENHTGNILKLLDERSKHMKQELKDTIKKIKNQLRKKHNIVLDERSIKEESLPKEEKDYMEKTLNTLVNKDDKEKELKEENKESESDESKEEFPQPEQEIREVDVEEPAKIEQKKEKQEETQEEKQEELDLKDVLKRRSIITKELSDEKL